MKQKFNFKLRLNFHAILTIRKSWYGACILMKLIINHVNSTTLLSIKLMVKWLS